MSVEDFWFSCLSNFLATIAGGVTLTVIFFFVKEKAFPIPNVNGTWYFEITTVTTAYIPYRGMVLRYVAMLWREGNRISGTVEKIYENSTTGERTFDGKNRTRGVVSGFVEKKYLSRDRIVLHVIEEGHGRESTNFFDLKVKSKNLDGEFSSMVAKQTGSAKWQRGEF